MKLHRKPEVFVLQLVAACTLHESGGDEKGAAVPVVRAVVRDARLPPQEKECCKKLRMNGAENAKGRFIMFKGKKAEIAHTDTYLGGPRVGRATQLPSQSRQLDAVYGPLLCGGSQWWPEA